MKKAPIINCKGPVTFPSIVIAGLQEMLQVLIKQKLYYK